MLQARVIPCLLLRDGALVKTVKFKSFRYVGDPINAVRIYNDMEVDELVILDISASASKRKPDFKLISEVAGECFMPLTYGGGITSIEDMKQLFKNGVEKVSINSAAYYQPELVSKAAELFGSQSIVVSIDVHRTMLGRYEVVLDSGKKKTGLDPVEYAKKMQALGAGEILLTSVEKDGTWEGYDLNLVKKVSHSISLPLIASGGAGSLNDIGQVVLDAGASAAALGSMAVFQGKDLGVLIKFPKLQDRERILMKKGSN